MRPGIAIAVVVVACRLSFTLQIVIAQETTVPRVMQFNGVIENGRVGLIPQIRSVTFALYRDQRGGSPLWQETQNVTIDSQGRFEMLLGTASREGLPMDLFSKGEPRWLGFQVNGSEGEQPRVLLGSVPYALKAGDAETLGGRRLSDFVLTSDGGAAPSALAARNVNCTNPCINSFEIEDGAITDTDISALAGIAPTKIVGTAATLGANTFSETQTITSGNLALPVTTAATSGVITSGGNRFLHNSGTYNTFLGVNAGTFDSATSFNTALGHSALSSNIAGNNHGGNINTAVGAFSLQSNTTGSGNTGLGFHSLRANTTGYSNTALGAESLFRNQTGKGNTAVGTSALTVNEGAGADYNTAVGYFTAASNFTGTENTAVGTYSMFYNQQGSHNTAAGTWALGSNFDGSDNVAVGSTALLQNRNGSSNTAVGVAAGAVTYETSNTTGSKNTFVGYKSGPGTSTQLTNATAVGANALVSASNALVLGDNAVSVGIGTQAPLTKLQVVGDIRVGTTGTNGCVQAFDGSPIAGTCSSDERLKQNIEPFASVLDKLIQLQPVSYEWRADEHPEYHFGSDRTTGLIAQEVEQVFPNMVSTDERGYKAVNYSQLPLLLLQAIREQQMQIQELKSELEQLRAQRKQENILEVEPRWMPK